MSGSDRGKRSQIIEGVFPTAGFVLSLSLALFVGHLSGEQEEKARASYQYTESAKERAQRECVGTDAARVFECVVEKVETSQQAARDSEDLHAQQQAAWAGTWGAAAAIAALLTTVLGLVWIKGTLDATRDGAKAALEAVRETAKSNQIAQRQFEHAFRPHLRAIARGPAYHPDNDRDPLRTFIGDPVTRRRMIVTTVIEIENLSDNSATIEEYTVYLTGEPAGLDPDAFVGPWRSQIANAILNKGERARLTKSGPKLVKPDAPFHPTDSAGAGMFVMTSAHLHEVRHHPPAIAGKVRYVDPIGNRRVFRFAFQPSGRGDEYEMWGGAEYNGDEKVEDTHVLRSIMGASPRR